MTGGSDMAVVIEITIMANNNAIVSDVKTVRTWTAMTSFVRISRKIKRNKGKKRKKS